MASPSKSEVARLPATAERSALDALLADIAKCRHCADVRERPLPHAPRPVLRVSATARIAVCGQAPGTRVHKSGIPFTDPSGVRLRSWMGVTEDEFYDRSRVAVVPMGFCFPGQDAKGGDLPPRSECAPLWRARVFAHLPDLELVLLVGHYAQRWHLGPACGPDLTATMCNWRGILGAGPRPRLLPLPHPSWRNNGWLKRHPWFATDLLPELRSRVRSALKV